MRSAGRSPSSLDAIKRPLLERLGLALPAPLRLGVAELLRAAGDALVDPAALVGAQRPVTVVQDAAGELEAVAPLAARQVNLRVAVPDPELIAHAHPLRRQLHLDR